jgi:hypothetical protein
MSLVRERIYISSEYLSQTFSGTGIDKRAMRLAELSKFCPNDLNSNRGFDSSPILSSSLLIV